MKAVESGILYTPKTKEDFMEEVITKPPLTDASRNGKHGGEGQSEERG